MGEKIIANDTGLTHQYGNVSLEINNLIIYLMEQPYGNNLTEGFYNYNPNGKSASNIIGICTWHFLFLSKLVVKFKIDRTVPRSQLFLRKDSPTLLQFVDFLDS